MNEWHHKKSLPDYLWRGGIHQGRVLEDGEVVDKEMKKVRKE
jgi:hypothetical protein